MIGEFQLPDGKRFRMGDGRVWDIPDDIPDDVREVLGLLVWDVFVDPHLADPTELFEITAAETGATLVKLNMPAVPKQDEEDPIDF